MVHLVLHPRGIAPTFYIYLSIYSLSIDQREIAPTIIYLCLGRDPCISLVRDVYIPVATASDYLPHCPTSCSLPWNKKYYEGIVQRTCNISFESRKCYRSLRSTHLFYPVEILLHQNPFFLLFLFLLNKIEIFSLFLFDIDHIKFLIMFILLKPYIKMFFFILHSKKYFLANSGDN